MAPPQIGQYAIRYLQYTVSRLCDTPIVCDHDNGLLIFFRCFFQERDNFTAVLRVQVSGRLIRQDEGGPGDQCTPYGDSLLLAAG